MTVKIKKRRLAIFLWCPDCLLALVIKSIVRHSNEQNSDFGIRLEITDKQQIRMILKALREAKKIHGKLQLISVKAADGTVVEIKL